MWLTRVRWRINQLTKYTNFIKLFSTMFYSGLTPAIIIFTFHVIVHHFTQFRQQCQLLLYR